MSEQQPSMGQQIITAEAAEKLRRYEEQLQEHLVSHRSMRRGWIYLAVIAAVLWPVSYLASSGTGPINMSAWFSAFTLFSFGGALLATAGAVGLSLVDATDSEPVPPKMEPREVS